jgi:hypothetical protein
MRSACLHTSVPLLSLALLAASLAGCASGKDPVDKQLSKLREEVAHLQSETDRMGERLDAMEVRQASTPKAPDERVALGSGTLSRPKLKVVHVEPGDNDAFAAASDLTPVSEEADTGPRLVIEGEGKSLESHTLPAGSAAKSPAPVSKTKADGAKSAKPQAATSK